MTVGSDDECVIRNQFLKLELKTSREANEKRISILQLELDAACEENVQLSNELQHVVASFARLKSEHNDLVRSLGEEREINIQLTNLNSKLTVALDHEMDQREDLCSSLRRFKAEASDEINETTLRDQSEIERLENEYYMMNTTMSQKFQHSQTEVAGLKEVNAKLFAELENSKLTIFSQQRDFEKIHAIELQKAVLLERVEQLEVQIEKSQRSESLMQKQLDQLSEKLSERNNELKQSKDVEEEYSRSIQCLKEEVDKLVVDFQLRIKHQSEESELEAFRRNTDYEVLLTKYESLQIQMNSSKEALKSQKHMLLKLDSNLDRIIRK